MRHLCEFGILIIVLGSTLLPMDVSTLAQANTPTLELELHLDGVLVQAKWNADETKLMIWGDDEAVHIYDAATGAELMALPHLEPAPGELTNWVLYADWSPDETLILTSGVDQQIKLWDAVTGDLLHTWTFPNEGDQLQTITPLWQPDGRHIFAYGSQSAEVRVWDVETGAEALVLQHPGPVVDAIFSPDGNRLLTSAMTTSTEALTQQLTTQLPETDTTDLDALRNMFDALDLRVSAYVWDSVTGKLLFELPNPEPQVHYLSWSRDGTHILTSTGVDFLGPIGAYIVESIQARKEGQEVPVMNLLTSLQAPSGVRIWNAETGMVETDIHQDRSIDLVQWSPDETQIMTSIPDGPTILWDALTGEMIRELWVPGALLEARWNADQSRIYGLVERPTACGLADCTYGWLSWDTSTGALLLDKEFSGPYAKRRIWNEQMTLAAWNYVDTEFWGNCSGDACKPEVVILDPLGNEFAHVPPNATIIEWNAAGNRLLTTDSNGYTRIWALDVF